MDSGIPKWFDLSTVLSCANLHNSARISNVQVDLDLDIVWDMVNYPDPDSFPYCNHFFLPNNRDLNASV